MIIEVTKKIQVEKMPIFWEKGRPKSKEKSSENLKTGDIKSQPFGLFPG